MPGQKANTITTELKRILPNAVKEAAILEGVVSRHIMNYSEF